LCWRTRSDDPAITPALIAAVKSAAPGIRVRNVATARDRLDGWLIREILVASLTGLFGLLALGLSAIGLYGVIAFGVARRTNEIGVRMALGARRNDVLALIMRQSAALTLAGLAIGAPLTLLAARALRSMLYGLSATDPAMLGLAVLILLAVAAAAGLVPAVRAAHIDPLAALRSE
jgi:ABC-type antimicrobial peptide transport system permease subunit